MIPRSPFPYAEYVYNLNSDRAMVVVPMYTMYTTLLPPRATAPAAPGSLAAETSPRHQAYLIIWAEGTGVRRARYIRVVTDGADGT